MTFAIRTAAVEDAAAIAAIYKPIVETTAISFEEAAPSIDEMATRIDTILANYPYLVAEREGQIAGYAYAAQHMARAAYRWSVNVSTYIDEDARGLGLGRALYQKLLADLSDRGFHTAIAGITLPNAASVGLHEAMGFAQVGVYREVGFKFGQWHDVGWWQRLL
ncbi:MAG: arsinothricin resistance N-acetyltransferase ArsN1 family B [Pseudomonadota bacterium]